MIKLKNHIFSIFAGTLLTCCCAGCASEAPEMSSPGMSGDGPMLGFTLGLSGPTRADGDDQFELGSGFENYLDIANNNYRIYFFSADNKYITTFTPIYKPVMSATPDATISGVDTYYYTFMGQFPTEAGTNFKIVVLANWPSYPVTYESAESVPAEGAPAFRMVKGTTTIADLCTHAHAQYAALAEGDGLDEGHLMPFYGVRAYNLNAIDNVKDNIDNDGKIKDGAYIDLRTSGLALPLIRAMAKVEVILSYPLASFESVKMTKINNKGFCAPYSSTDDWKFDYTDYFHNYVWGDDFTRYLHLTNNGKNDDSTGTLSFKKVTAEGIFPEKWVAYVPEYKNDGDDYTAIEVEVTLKNADPDQNANDGADQKLGKNTIEFAPDGKAPAVGSSRYNIERNNIYRFTITGMNAVMNVKVDIQPYAECKLEYDLGLMRDERGDLMVFDESTFMTQMLAVFKNYPRMVPRVGQYDANGVFHIGKYNDNGDFTRVELPEGGLYAPIPEGTEVADPLNINNDLNDYYAIVMPENGAIRESEIWLKDAQGCRVLSNFKDNIPDDDDNVENDAGCYARLVRDFSLLTPTDYYKDKHGMQRKQHNRDHSSIVLNHEKELWFKTVIKVEVDGHFEYQVDRLYPVESWNETTREFWYRINIQYNADNPKKVDITYRKGTEEGEPPGGSLFEPDKVLTVGVDELSEQDKSDLDKISKTTV